MYTGREWDEDLSLYYFRDRMYDPYSGRFCSRDPIGYDGGSNNLYQYVQSRPLVLADPMGLQAVNPVPSSSPVNLATCSAKHPPSTDWDGYARCLECFDKLTQWLDANSDTSWMKSLKNCPCKIVKEHRRKIHCLKDRYYTELEWYIPAGWHNDPGTPFGYHPGATQCIRTSNQWFPTTPQQQCCYDSVGALITSGPGAGTPDRNDPSHADDETEPFDCAHYLDGTEDDYSKQGYHVSLFIGMRTPNNGNGCKANKGP